MSILAKFEELSKQTIFPSDKESVFLSTGLHNILKYSNNQMIRTLLSENSAQFADMSRVVKLSPQYE